MTTSIASIIKSLKSISPPIAFFILIILSLYLLGGLSQTWSSFVIWGVKELLITLNITSPDISGILGLPKTITQYLDYLQLRPNAVTYKACSRCYKLHPLHVKPIPIKCAGQYECSPCDESLDSAFTIVTQSFDHWLGSRLLRPGWEASIRNYSESMPPPIGSGPLLENGRMRDIWHGCGFADEELAGQGGVHFFPAQGKDLHLAFALGVDGFNPYTLKIAGVTASAHVYLLICLSLPPAMRYEPDNIFIYSVFPGSPNTERSNHIIAPLVDRLDVFWTTGVHFTSTNDYPEGRVVRAILGPLLCDLVAARQVAGHASHCSKGSPCTVCYAGSLDWQGSVQPTLRTNVEQREAAYRWKNAATREERDALVAATGVRYSELLRLKYWDPTKMIVADSLHQLLLGIIQRFCRDVWGLSSTNADTEGIEPVPPTGTTAAALEKARAYLDQRKWTELGKSSTALLYRLCYEHDLWRGSRTKERLLIALQSWVGLQRYS